MYKDSPEGGRRDLILSKEEEKKKVSSIRADGQGRAGHTTGQPGVSSDWQLGRQSKAFLSEHEADRFITLPCVRSSRTFALDLICDVCGVFGCK